MKRFVYPLILLFACCLFSCESQGPNGNGNEPVKYIVEYSSWTTYQQSLPSEYLNIPSKTLYTRKQGDSKYLLGMEQYSDNKLEVSMDVTNDGNKEVRNIQCLQCSDEYKLQDETYIWQDEQRTKCKEWSNSYGSKTIIEYDNKDRQVAVYSYYNDKLVYEYSCKYVGLKKYGEGKDYTADGSLIWVSNDTVTYVDKTFSQILLSCSAGRETSNGRVNTSRTEYEYGPYGIISSRDKSIKYDSNGNVSFIYERQCSYTWSDALNNTYKGEGYENGHLTNKYEGYEKYTY